MSHELWTLWMDESGSGIDGPDVVAGLLTHPDAADLLEAFRCALHRDLPWVPWPLHTTEFNRLEMHAVWLHQHVQQPKFAPSGILVGREAALQVFLAAISSDRDCRTRLIELRPHKQTGRSPAGWHELASRVKLPRACLVLLNQLHQDAQQVLGNNLHLLLQELERLALGTALFAGHAERQVVQPIVRRFNQALPSPLDRKSGWTRMAAEVVARGCDWLAAPSRAAGLPGPSTSEPGLLPHPLQRNQADPAFIAQAAPILLAGSPTSSAAPPLRLAPKAVPAAVAAVRVMPTVISEFDRSSPPGHVVADILSNRARPLFAGVGFTLPQLQQELSALGLPARPLVPLVAAAGDSSVRLRSARATGNYAGPGTGLLPWADEQAAGLLRSGARGWWV